MTLSDYIRLLRRGWLVILALTLIGLGLGALTTRLTAPTYDSIATVLLSAAPVTAEGQVAPSNDALVQKAITYSSLVTSTTVVAQAATTLGEDVPTLRASIGSSVRTGTPIIDVYGTGGTGQLAADRANASAAALVSRLPQLDAGDGGNTQLQVLTPAEVSQTPTTPRPRNNLLIGAVVGLAIGVGLLIALQTVDTRIRSVADLPRGSRFTTVTSLPMGIGRTGLIGKTKHVTDPRLESFRHLRANLQFSADVRGAIAVAGVTRASHAAQVADQLSGVLGEIGLRTVVVDVDLRSAGSRSHRNLSVDDGQPGLSEVLSGVADLQEVIQQGASEGVWVIGAGTAKESTAQLLSTSHMSSLIDQLVDNFDYVLLACPPIVERSEASVMAALARSVLVVVDSGTTKGADFLYALELLAGVGVTDVSVAIDQVRSLDLGRTPKAQPAAP